MGEPLERRRQGTGDAANRTGRMRQRTSTGEAMPDFVAALRRARRSAGRHRTIRSAKNAKRQS